MTATTPEPRATPAGGAVIATVVPCPSCGHPNRVPAAAAGLPRCGACHSALPWMAEAGDDDFRAVAEESSLPVLVDFWAPWCGPCRMVTPALERLARERAGEVKLVKVNVDESPQVAGRFGVQSIPTLTVLRGTEELARQIGALPEPRLRTWLADALPAPARSPAPPPAPATTAVGDAAPAPDTAQ